MCNKQVQLRYHDVFFRYHHVPDDIEFMVTPALVRLNAVVRFDKYNLVFDFLCRRSAGHGVELCFYVVFPAYQQFALFDKDLPALQSSLVVVMVD